MCWCRYFEIVGKGNLDCKPPLFVALTYDGVLYTGGKEAYLFVCWRRELFLENKDRR